MNYRDQFRRSKKDPCADFWHTIRIGVAAFLLLLIILPKIL